MLQLKTNTFYNCLFRLEKLISDSYLKQMVLVHFPVNSNKSILNSNYICSVEKLGITLSTLDLVLVFLSALNQFLYHKQTLES